MNFFAVKKDKKKNYNFSLFFIDYLSNKTNLKKNIPSGLVVSWGRNKHLETSHNNYDMLSLPRVVFKLSKEEINKIYCGVEHNIVLTVDNKLFGWGQNESGQCGIEPSKNKILSDPTQIDSLNPFKIKEVSCGSEHTLALTEEGELYSFGKAEDGVLGYDTVTEISHIPQKISFFTSNNIKIESISTGSIHNIALDTEGKVYSWGSNLLGELGFQMERKNVSPPSSSTPSQINCLPRVEKVACGEGHSIAICEEGAVYSWGYGSCGQLGLGFCEHSVSSGKIRGLSHNANPTRIQGFSSKNVRCGKTFTMFLNEKGELYSCGVNNEFQLGIKKFSKALCYDIIIPTRVDAFINMKVLKIACGESHCIAIIQDTTNNMTNLWSWGSNTFGQLGHGTPEKSSLPKPLNYFLYYKNMEIIDIACGEFHSLCLLRNSQIPSSTDHSLIFSALKDANTYISMN